MSASDITVTNDAMKVNADSTTAPNGTMYYESDNEKVVKVSSTGVVTAVGAGTANVTGYMIVGGRKFPTNTVTFTVNAGSRAAASAAAAAPGSAGRNRADSSC